MHKITIVSIGPGDPDLLNNRTIRALRESECLILRTSQTALSKWLISEGIVFESLDRLYEKAEDFDGLNRSVAETLLREASDHAVVYAVADPYTDESVRKLLETKDGSSEAEIIPGVSMADVFLSAVPAFAGDSSPLVIPASEMIRSIYNPRIPLLITEIDDPFLAGQVKIALSGKLSDEQQIFHIHIGNDPVPIPLYEADRLDRYDHLTAFLVPASDYMNRDHFVPDDLSDIMYRLISPGGCPWDREQTHETLRPYMIEEAWECIASIDQKDYTHLSEELGDLLFQIVFHAALGSKYDEFTMQDVIDAICAKMIRRHPHVFGTSSAVTADEVVHSWEKLKQSETGSRTFTESLDDVTDTLPSLKYASKIIRKLNQAEAFRRGPDEVMKSLREKLDQDAAGTSPREETDVGMLLFLLAELCFSLNRDAELELHRYTNHLIAGIKRAEERIKSDGKAIEHLTFNELGVYLKHVEGEIE